MNSHQPRQRLRILLALLLAATAACAPATVQERTASTTQHEEEGDSAEAPADTGSAEAAATEVAATAGDGPAVDSADALAPGDVTGDATASASASASEQRDSEDPPPVPYGGQSKDDIRAEDFAWNKGAGLEQMQWRALDGSGTYYKPDLTPTGNWTQYDSNGAVVRANIPFGELPYETRIDAGPKVAPLYCAWLRKNDPNLPATSC